MNNEPDFIVDPSGDVRDVRSQKSVQPPSTTAWQPSSDGTYRPDRPPQRTQPYTGPKPGGGVILLPIGLIITLVYYLIRLILGLGHSDSSATFVDISEGSSGRVTYSAFAASSVRSGLRYYRQGDYEKAISEFSMAINSDPHMPEAYNDRGIAYDALGDQVKAMADLNYAIQIAPEYAAPYNNRGGLYLSQKKDELALADFNKAIDLNPRFGKAFYNRALFYLASENYQHAISDLTQAIDLAPEQVAVVYATMDSRSVTGENIFGGRSLSLGFEDDLTNSQIYDSLPEAHQLRGLAYRQTGEELKAQADLEKAAALGLSDEQALLLGIFFIQRSIELNTDQQETDTTPLATPPETFPDIFTGEMSFRYGPAGGNVSALAIDPFQPVTLYAGTAGGVYKSIDNGENWRPVDTSLPSSYVTALAIDPSVPDTIYAATTLGLYKSTDGGELWNAGIRSGSAGNEMLVTALAVDPAHPTTLYAGTAFGMFKSIDGGLTWSAGLSGANFVNVDTIVIDPWDPTTLYAGDYRGISKSTDGGETWNEANPGSITGPVHALAIDPMVPSTLYAGTEQGVYKTTDGGETWAPLGADFVGTPVQLLAIDPLQPTSLYIGFYESEVILIIQMDSGYP